MESLTLSPETWNARVLAGVAQWTGCQPANCKVASSIPCRGMCLGWGPGPHLGGVGEAPS